MNAEHSLNALARLIEEWLADSDLTAPEHVRSLQFYLDYIRQYQADAGSGVGFDRVLRFAQKGVTNVLNKIESERKQTCKRPGMQYIGNLQDDIARLESPVNWLGMAERMADKDASRVAELLRLQGLVHSRLDSITKAQAYDKPPAVICTWKLQTQDVSACMN